MVERDSFEVIAHVNFNSTFSKNGEGALHEKCLGEIGFGKEVWLLFIQSAFFKIYVNTNEQIYKYLTLHVLNVFHVFAK